MIYCFLAIFLGFFSQNYISEKRYFLTHYVKSKPHNKIMRPFPIGSGRDLSLNTSLLGEQKYEITAELKMVLPYAYSTTVEINSLSRILLRICSTEHAEVKQNKCKALLSSPHLSYRLIREIITIHSCYPA